MRSQVNATRNTPAAVRPTVSEYFRATMKRMIAVIHAREMKEMPDIPTAATADAPFAIRVVRSCPDQFMVHRRVPSSHPPAGPPRRSTTGSEASETMTPIAEAMKASGEGASEA
jgi:hypothetical protein